MQNTELVRHWRNRANLEKRLKQQNRMIEMAQTRYIKTLSILSIVGKVDFVWKGFAFMSGSMDGLKSYVPVIQTDPYRVAHLDTSNPDQYNPVVKLFENGNLIYEKDWNPKAADNIALNWVAFGKKPKGGK